MQFSLKTDYPSALKTAAWVLPIAIVFPIIVHLAPPYNGIPIGAYLLPMFYIPLVALIAYRLPVALIAAALSPFFNFFLTGNPNWGFMGILTGELVIFTLLANLLLQGKLRWIAAPTAYIGAKVISSTSLLLFPFVETSPFLFFSSSLVNATTGILILLVINILSLKYLPSQKGAN
ncbi:hypothetical protein [uncultured Cyclobacterium sp.]|uniref:hypothetical protein n=1 Tax=uncultured Cyclobacterium sp. TaxID=453820 RepID=UPI0030EE9322|tara:strand:- start:77622 stop:78149 length:528 start_codon:yes stop_codon:yes gene_type:complete